MSILAALEIYSVLVILLGIVRLPVDGDVKTLSTCIVLSFAVDLRFGVCIPKPLSVALIGI